MVVFQQPADLAPLRRNDSPFGLKQFALRPLRFDKSGYRRTHHFTSRTPHHRQNRV
jgi:hypothetical protein